MNPESALWTDLLVASGLTDASEEQWSAAYERLLSGVQAEHAETMSRWLFQPPELSQLAPSASASPPAWATTAQSALFSIAELDRRRVEASLLSLFDTYQGSAWPSAWARELWIETWGALRRPEQLAQLTRVARLDNLTRSELLALIFALGETPHLEAEAELVRIQAAHATDPELIAELELARSCRVPSDAAVHRE